MAYIPPNQNYLPYDWSGVVTANDIAIQNQPWSLGQHLGPTREQQAQKEMEDWFRAQGLNPNQYYAPAGSAAPPQPGYNPAGVKVNQSNRKQAPLAEQLQGWTGDPAELAAALNPVKLTAEQRKEAKKYEQEHTWNIDRKALLKNPGVAMPLIASAATAKAGSVWPGAPAPTPSYNPAADNGAPSVMPTTAPTASAAPKTFLPPYLQPGAATAGAPSSIPPPGQATMPLAGVPPITQPGSSLTSLMPQGFATPRPVTPGLAPVMTGQPRTGGGGFGATAKLLELPWYLRQQGRAY